MINVQRETESPASLTTDEVKQYLSDLALYLQDEENNPEPRKPSYRNWDVLEAFDRCFYSKCYLTETKKENSWGLEIDHFIPQNESPELVHEWTNLFPCEHSTNKLRTRRTPDGGYLNPTIDDDNVEILITYSADFQFEKITFDPTDFSNLKAKNTCSLLSRVHNGHDEWSKKTTANLRAEMRYRANEILKEIDRWRNAEEDSSQKQDSESVLRGFLSRKSSFTMLMRSMPIVQKYCTALFD